MADHFSRIFGTEEDKQNCPFFLKIGACRHGDRCARAHLRPPVSQTILVPHLYVAQTGPDGLPIEDREGFEDFYRDVLQEMMQYGTVVEMMVVKNLGEHLFGNVYVQFSDEEIGERALKGLTGRWFAGKQLTPEYSPVSDFREARCRQNDDNECQRGGYCNFMHMIPTPRWTSSMLRRRRRERSRSRDRRRDRSRDRGANGSARSESEERRAKIAQWNSERQV